MPDLDVQIVLLQHFVVEGDAFLIELEVAVDEFQEKEVVVADEGGDS